MTLRVPSNDNIGRLSGRVMLQLRDDLDTAPESQNWRALSAILREPYVFKQQEIERFAMQIYSNGSPANQLLLSLGGRGMTVKELVHYLDQLKLEKILREFKNYEPIEIQEQPESLQKLYAGEKLVVFVRATGFPYPRYQWFKGDTRIDRATESMLTINNVKEKDSGDYICRLHNSADNNQVKFSDYGSIRVYPKSLEEEECFLPVITGHPRNSYVFNGHSFILLCEAKGRQPMRYRWFNEDKFYKESHIPYFQVDNATPHDSGRYTCTVINDFGQAVSIPAVIMVANEPQPHAGSLPQIIQQPVSCQVPLGSPAMFVCEGCGQQPLQYQWFQDGFPIPGATLSQLALPQVQREAVLHCQVSNRWGRACSNTVFLRIQITSPMPHTVGGYSATDKVALLIGNYNYRCEISLKAPKTDIQILSDIFRRLDFKVVSLLNLTLNEMKAAVDAFCELLGDGVYSVFYFCGHGFEEKGHCYFVPEDAQTDFKETDCLSANSVLDSLQRKKPKICTMILDICRKKNKNGPPVEETVSVAPRANSEGNSCICYATCAGMAAYEIGESGILVKHLQKYLSQPMKIEDVFSCMRHDIGKEELVKGKQIPEVITNILQPGRSFTDQIAYRNGWTEAFNRRQIAWEHAHKVPASVTILACKDLGIVLELEFQSIFSNVLHVFVTVKDKGQTEECIAWIARIPTTVSVADQPTIVTEGKTRNSIQDIQKLKNDLEITLSVKYRVKSKVEPHILYPDKVNLGMPLVAQLRLWEPRNAKSSLREPTEQAEEVDATNGSHSM
ncbi:mucosa-associated lymphoid tissue lymphoma translocation protein 1 homolog isoform X3 [Haliotis rubra]|uniref:mucosa-associated lymphoid tissue lymphoma translocation protein 1 homolog isoform X3 n=1 Tax=Haliotis rubra TaxID=36100 RepID=UPI001EE6057B|nr:mucosa-associated lymphoid tissue lymphoma translocation protein 1 homolog isoform X3 [Haliotis rubra]